MTKVKADIRSDVKQYYTEAARQGSACCDTNTLYTPEMISGLPADVANFSLGCGNPITAANLRPGETVLDLGSGGGLDCLFAAREVGESGYVIGVDMTPEMLARANRAAAKLEISNVDFRQGFLEKLPVDDGTVDVVISNCVINLSPDKPQVFAEIFRVLKPGGRVAVSDIVSQGEIPEEILAKKYSWSSCEAGALPAAEFLRGMLDAGFMDVDVQAKDAEGNLLEVRPDAHLYSALISARKPG